MQIVIFNVGYSYRITYKLHNAAATSDKTSKLCFCQYHIQRDSRRDHFRKESIRRDEWHKSCKWVYFIWNVDDLNVSDYCYKK